MLSEGKQKIFQARWRDENSQKLVQLEVLKGANEICRFRTFQKQEGKVNYELMSIPFSVSFHKKTFWHRKKKKKEKAKSSLFFSERGWESRIETFSKNKTKQTDEDNF